MDFRSAPSLDEALAILGELGSDAQILAGGTDVMMQLARRELNPAVLVHIERIPDLDSIEVNSTAHLGGLATHLAISRHDSLKARYPSIAYAASTVGGWQTQAIGTVAGNVCNASPAADLIPPLLVHDTQVQLASAGGRRTVALADFILDRRSVDRRPDEMVVGFDLAEVVERSADVYLKVARRRAMEVAVVGLAVSLSLDEDLATITSARVAAGAVGPVVFRAAGAEAALIGSAADGDHPEAGEALQEQAAPVDDARSTASYRARVLPGVLDRAVAACVASIRNRAS